MNNNQRFGKVAVLMGGRSAEREISLLSGIAVLEALQRQGVDAQSFDPIEGDWGELAKFDSAFIALHGRGGEDGSIQGLLDSFGVPYTGSGVMASALGMDKWRTKLVWQASKISTPAFCMLNANSNFKKVVAELGLPLIVKPAREGSSIGITKVKTSADLAPAYQCAALVDSLVMAEAFVEGAEYTVAVVEEHGKLIALPLIRIETQTEFYDFEAKYRRNDTCYHCPCGLPETLEHAIQSQALHAFQVLGATGWGRIDLMVDQHQHAYFIEVNTVPGMTKRSLVPKAAQAQGLSFEDLVLGILKGAKCGTTATY